MKQRALVISVLVALGLALVAAWWWHTFELVDDTVRLPPRGEARYNDLYALARALEARDVDVRSRAAPGLQQNPLAPGDLLVLGADVRTLAERDVDLLLAAVEQGAHLVLALPASAEGRSAELLDRLGIYVVEGPACAYWRSEPSPEERRSLCSPNHFVLDDSARAQFTWLCCAGSERVVTPANAGAYVLGRRTYGEGTVFVAGHLRFLRNDRLRRASNAALAWQVLAPALGSGTVHLVYSADVPPLHVLLLRHGWPVVIPLALALLAWLWSRSARLGPLQRPPSSHRRALLDHVRATGELAFRRGRALALHAAMKRAVLQRIARIDPGLAALEGEALVQALAARYGRSAGELRHALAPTDVQRPHPFLLAIRTLAALRTAVAAPRTRPTPTPPSSPQAAPP